MQEHTHDNQNERFEENKVADEQRLASDMASHEQQVDINLNPDAPAEGQEKKEENKLEDLLQQLSQAQSLAEKNKDLYLRAVADLDTYRRKVQREKSELAKFAQQPIIEELLPSLDHLEMAIAAAANVPAGKNIAMGVEMVSSQIKKVFANFGVEEISPLGKDFDPNTAEAMSNQPSDTVDENKVLKVVRTG